MPKADLLKIYETYRQANLIQEGMKVVEAPAGDASAANMGPGGVIEVQPDGQYPEGEAPKQNVDAEEGGGPREDEDWRAHMTRNIVAKGADFLRAVYELGYTGEAGENDINEIVGLLTQEAEGDDRLKQALDAVVGHMVNAGHADF